MPSASTRRRRKPCAKSSRTADGPSSLTHFSGLLGIPNQTVKQLMYGYLRDAWRDSEAFVVTSTPWSA